MPLFPIHDEDEEIYDVQLSPEGIEICEQSGPHHTYLNTPIFPVVQRHDEQLGCYYVPIIGEEAVYFYPNELLFVGDPQED